jgi:undecaprenyl pyrophosphate synthase
VMWPDFGHDDLLSALAAFSRRRRRFGRVTASVA